MNPKIIAFDADDTLWHNEPYFDEAQERFCVLFQDYASHQEILGLILNHQVNNLPLYGFGIKAFTLSMIETALELTNHQIAGKGIEQILAIGKDLLQKPVELLPNITAVLEQLQGKYKLVVATKGDLKDQHRKLHDSGIGAYFRKNVRSIRLQSRRFFNDWKFLKIRCFARFEFRRTRHSYSISYNLGIRKNRF
jgi:putative hydrolase of the HAD superfamily